MNNELRSQNLYLHKKAIKRNQIGRRFAAFFKILTDTSYYEGTKYAKYFNQLTDDSKSDIYVYDPLEAEFDKLMKSTSNQFKYFVGLTGMGKTTLLRNYFRITNRDVKLNQNDLVLYISFYYSDLISDQPEQSVRDVINSYLERTVDKLLEKYARILGHNETFWDSFYSFIEDNKPTLLYKEGVVPGSSLLDYSNQNLSDAYKIDILKTTKEKRPLEYFTSLIKYILSYTKESHKLVLIYDDIESKDEIYHKPVIEVARHIQSCFSAIEGDRITVISIVSLRAYTFRCNISRQLEARREIISKDVILKKEAVDIKDIFHKRFDAIEKIESINTTDNYIDAKRELSYVLNQLDKIGKGLIYNISNYNLCDAMIVFSNVLTNLNWIACDEKEYKGAFQIDSKNYRITTENLMYAISEIPLNTDCKDQEYIPNIFYSDVEGSELIGLYIIRYLIINHIDEVYGTKYIEGNKLISEIKSLFVKNVDSYIPNEYWNFRIKKTLEHLYRSGILFRSVYDIEIAKVSQVDRMFDEEYKLYLSPRGKALYNLLSKNAVLLELYRVDLFQKSNSSLNSSFIPQNTFETFDDILSFLIEYFQIEKRNIAAAIPDLNSYQNKIGEEFIVSTLLEGVLRNILSYFRVEDDEYHILLNKTKSIFDTMIKYADEIQEQYKVTFLISSFLCKRMSNHNQAV